MISFEGETHDYEIDNKKGKMGLWLNHAYKRNKKGKWAYD